MFHANRNTLTNSRVHLPTNIVQGWAQREDEFNRSTAPASTQSGQVVFILKGGSQYEVEYPDVPRGGDILRVQDHTTGASGAKP